MIRLNIGKIAHLFTLILVIILIWAGKAFLLAHPLVSVPILILFSILYLVISLHLNTRLLIYPSIALFVLAYFLGTYHLNPYPYQAPLLSVTLIGLFLLLALKQKNRQLIYKPSIHSIYVLITSFSFYIIYYANHYAQTDQIVPIVTLTFFASVLGLRSLINKKQLFRYWSLITVSLAFIFLLYSITLIPLGHYSLYMMVFFVCMMHIGTLVHRKTDSTQARPFYLVGFFGLAIAPLYSVHHTDILLILQALYALHFWEIHLEMNTIEHDCKKKGWICRIFNIMVYPLTLVSLALIIQKHFPVSYSTIGTCMIFAFMYFKMAHEQQLRWKKTDLHLPVFGITFLTIAYITTLFMFFDPNSYPVTCLALIPLIWLLLFIGRIYSKKERNKLGFAIYKTQYLSTVVILAIPFFLKKANIHILLGLNFSFLLTYMLMYLRERWVGFFYAIPITFSYLYYLLIINSSIPNIFISLYFISPGIAAALLGLWFQSKKSRWSEVFFFWWHTLSLISLVLLDTFHVSSGYCLAIWGVIYLITGTFAKNLTEKHRSCLRTAGHTLAMAAALFIPFLGHLNPIIHVNLLIGIGYLIIYLAINKGIYLYPVAITGVVAYSLFFLWGFGWDVAHLGIIPFLFLVYGIWDLLFIRYKTNQGIALKRIGHLTTVFYTVMLFFNQAEIHVETALISLIIYLALYCFLIIIHRGYDTLFLAFGIGSVICFEFIKILNTMSPEMHLRLFSFIMIPLCICGYLLWKLKDEKWAFPVFDLIVIISLITTLVCLLNGYVWTTQMILIMSAVLFMLLSLLLKKDLYIFLTTLCLGLSAYNSLIAAQDRFTIDLVVYVLYTMFFIGFFFFLPIMKRILNYHGPRYMIRAINWKAFVFYGSIMSVLIMIFFFLYSLQLANFPGFCTKCHFMKPYAEAWAHSTHKQINCVDCHYEPGLRPVIKGKINGLVSVVKYVTHTYSIKPNSEINDASCLRSGCHNKMNLHQDIVFKKGISFNHFHHLKLLRRGKQLRCTTCHSQIVQGEHLTVTESICFTCHFKGRNSEGTGIGKCTSCHNPPIEPVVYQGIEFDHHTFLEGKSETLCIDCHSGVTQGDGRVPTERCFSCHTEENPDLTNPESLHIEHITKRKVECFECHLDIQHGIKIMSSQIKWECTECHSSSHAVPEKMYLGIGAMNLSSDPDPMFTAKVSCKGCHKYRETVQIGSISFETTKADVKACDECHGLGSGYTDLAIEWQGEIREKLESLVVLRKKLENPIKQISDKGQTDIGNNIIQIYERAVANLQFISIDGSYGVHNYTYTSDLLDTIEKDFARCDSFIGKK